MREQGFTLLEIVIAMTMLSLIATGAGQALLKGQQHARIIEQDREIRAICQTLIMDLAGREWGTSGTVGTIEYMKNKTDGSHPVEIQFKDFPGERGEIIVTDETTGFAEKKGTGKVYKIEVVFRQHSFETYVVKVD